MRTDDCNFYAGNLDSVSASKIPGWNRRVFFSNCEYGKRIKNVNARNRFCLVGHQRGEDVLVEVRIFHPFPDGRFKDVQLDPNWLKNLLEDTKYKDLVSIVDDRAFIKGYSCDVPDWVKKNISLERIRFSNAIGLIQLYGDQISVAWHFQDKVFSMKDATEIDKCLQNIIEFSKEMETVHSYQNSIDSLKANLSNETTYLSMTERDMNKCHSKYQTAMETLKRLGVSYRFNS